MRARPLRRAAPALLLLLLSAACAAPVTQVRVQPLSLPAGLLACLPQPEPPPDSADDADLASWVLDLAEAGADCRAKLDRVRDLVAAQAAPTNPGHLTEIIR
ncbi:Rz1-like lysis system protein LysC [Roseomonas chloroacetimidivorans]|uniref:Rz1-like lysis system protein LysC n=1 Tax=Roseomonas chloroacetimidivorans TaxID=1766656 RepID=UPI003C753D80